MQMRNNTDSLAPAPHENAPLYNQNMPETVADSSEMAGKRDNRLRRVLHGGASSLLERGAALLISAISLPLTVRYLGPQQYGIWVTISSMVVMLQVMDLGIANSLTNMISRAYAREHDIAAQPEARAEAQRYYATALWTCSAISAALGLIAFVIWPHVQWGSFFKVTEPNLSHQVSLCLAIALTFFLLSLPLNLVNRVLSGYQQTQITNYFNLLSNALGLLAILAVMRMHGSLVMLMLLYSATLMSGTLALNLWMNLWHRPWIFPKPTVIDRTVIRGLISTGFGFFLLQLAGMVVVNSDNLVITHYLGAADVVPYSVTWKLAGYATVLQTAIFPSLWPAYAEAYARGDYTWVRKTFWRAAYAGMGTVTLAVTAFALFGRTIIRWYVGPAAVPTEILLVAICIWIVISTGMDLEACFLAAINRVRLQGALSIVAAVLNLGLSIYFVKRIGPLGVILGTIISYAVTLIGPQTWIVWRGLYHPPKQPAVEVTHGV
jgi:O-antigen/teichoic acid export membrane protein